MTFFGRRSKLWIAAPIAALALATVIAALWSREPKFFPLPDPARAPRPEGAPQGQASAPGSAPAKSEAEKSPSPADARAGEALSPSDEPRAAGDEITERFRSLAAKTLAELPKIADLRKLSPEEAHGTPSLLIEAGHQLGQIVQLLHDHPELKEEGVRFYRECASSDGVSTAVRALCYANLRDLRQLHGLPDTSESEGYAPEVVRLGSQL